jgi:hypothetical protein
MKRTTTIGFAISVLGGCMSAQPGPVDQYAVRQIGTTTYIEKTVPATTRSVAGAAIGIGIASGQQSKPIPLKPGTDYACKYQGITTADMAEKCRNNQ